MIIYVFGLRGFPQVQGGVEKHCNALYTHFDSEDIEFYVFRRKAYVVTTPSWEHIHFIDLPSTCLKGFEAAFHSLLATIYCLFHKSDIIHIHNIGPALFIPLLRLFGKKVIVTYHSANYEHEKWNWFAKKILKLSEFITFSCATHIIFVNKFKQQAISAKYSFKTSYVPNGVDDNIERSNNINEIEKLGLTKDKYILSVGRITPEKGFDILAEAFNDITDKSIKLCIAGAVETEQNFYELVKSKVKDSNRIVFTGFVTGETLRQLYSHSRLYVLASRNEGFPLALLDAMAYNSNILTSDIPAAHIIELPTQCYFEIGNISNLTKKIEEALLLEKPSTFNLSDFNWSTIANQVYKIYKSVIKT